MLTFPMPVALGSKLSDIELNTLLISKNPDLGKLPVAIMGAVESEPAFLGTHPGGIAGTGTLVDAHHARLKAVGHLPGRLFAEDHCAQTVGTVIGPTDGVIDTREPADGRHGPKGFFLRHDHIL